MSSPLRIAVISDIHYAGEAERRRVDPCCGPIRNPVRRLLVRQYRHWIWLRDPFAHNHLLDRFLQEAGDADYVVANGDYSCDTAYIGLEDDAAFASAQECLSKLRGAFGERFVATFGDHEIGKLMMAAHLGGLRLRSFHRTARELQVEPLWVRSFGRYVLIGVTSSVVAFPVFQPEALPEEVEGWNRLRDQHMAAIRTAFAAVQPGQRILLFCHDPTALPYLLQEEAVRSRLPQLERTILGHLHSTAVLRLALKLSGMPHLTFLGHTPRRLSAAVRKARVWDEFRPLLCPSPSGVQLFKDGGYYWIELDPDSAGVQFDPIIPARFEFQPLPW